MTTKHLFLQLLARANNQKVIIFSIYPAVPNFNRQLISFRNLRAFFSILLLDTALPSNQNTLQLIMIEVFNSSILETFLESAPQFILQSSIIIRTGNICKSNAFWLVHLPRCGSSVGRASVRS